MGSDGGDRCAVLPDHVIGPIGQLLCDGVIGLGRVTGRQPQRRQFRHGDCLAGCEHRHDRVVSGATTAGIEPLSGLGFGGVVGIHGRGGPSHRVHRLQFGCSQGDPRSGRLAGLACPLGGLGGGQGSAQVLGQGEGCGVQIELGQIGGGHRDGADLGGTGPGGTGGGLAGVVVVGGHGSVGL